MPSPPETDREYAYFRASGSGDSSEITDLLGIEPDRCWRVGEEFELRGHKHRRKFSSWELDSRLNDTEPVNTHVEALISKLRHQRDALLKVGTQFQTQFVCVSYMYQSFGLVLDFDIQREATELGIGFSFAIYSFGDFHDEIVDLREQLELRIDGKK